jgi:lysyl-tRNA synthetase class I
VNGSRNNPKPVSNDDEGEKLSLWNDLGMRPGVKKLMAVPYTITPQGFGAFDKPAEEQLNQLVAELPRLQGEVEVMKVNQISTEDVLSESDTLYNRWPALAIDDRRKIAETLCEKITIGDGKIRITFTGAPSSGELCKSLTRR